MRAHDWVNEVEQPVTTETVGRETRDHPGGEGSSEGSEKEEDKKDGEKQEEEVKGEEEEKGEKENDPRSAEVKSTPLNMILVYFFTFD